MNDRAPNLGVAEPDRRGVPATQRHTLLVVDDEPHVVRSLQDLLRLDYRVLGATRAADALELMRREAVDVVLSDQRMPDTSGVDFLSRVRELYPDTVRLLITGYSDIRTVIDAINRGHVFRYIAKPWDPDELQTVIRQAVQQYEMVAERRRLIDELETANAHLRQALEQLKQSDQLKSAFIQVASHELRTPLTIVLLLARLAAQVPQITPQLRDLLDRITSASGRLRYLVDQLITMLAAGSFSDLLTRGPVDLSRLLESAAEDVRPFVTQRRQDLRVQVPPDLGEFELDEPKIRDCLNHLLLNAIKFTPDGGHITLDAHADDHDAATVRISDTGVGIDPAELPRVFDPFFTGFNVLTHSTGVYEFNRRGLGLGLSVVKAFIEMHGGSVGVQSEPGRGSTFTLTLPRHGHPRRPTFKLR